MIRIYENGTPGLQDGTEVPFLQFDAGILSEGTSKKVTKTFCIRTDGEIVENVEIVPTIMNDDGTEVINTDVFAITKREGNAPYYSTGYYPNNGLIIVELKNENFRITMTAYVYQQDGETDTRAKLYFIPVKNKLIVQE